jgi:type IV secretion system protein VirB9
MIFQRFFIPVLFFTFAVITVAKDVRAADIPVPVATDSRIKTLVYNENDVYSLLTHYGYQSNIEFSPQEEIETISIGDRVGWQIIPAGRRLFVRAMEEFARTNMTVVTNRRAYQFDLKSTSSTTTPNEELVYVVRFFYPDDRKNRLAPAPYSDDIAPMTGVVVPVTTPPQIPASSAAPIVQSSSYNYNYTFTGPDRLAPTKLYDDGASTYFKFAGAVSAPQILMVLPTGKEVPLEARQEGDFWVVRQTAARFSVRLGSDVVCIYNEMLSRKM